MSLHSMMQKRKYIRDIFEIASDAITQGSAAFMKKYCIALPKSTMDSSSGDSVNY